MPEHPYSIDEAKTLATQGIPTFTECSFDASVDGARIKPGGDLQITMVVPQSQKYAAIQLTDAVGIMVTITAKRKRRNP